MIELIVEPLGSTKLDVLVAYKRNFTFTHDYLGPFGSLLNAGSETFESSIAQGLDDLENGRFTHHNSPAEFLSCLGR